VKLEITKELDSGYDRHEFILEVDDELLNVYRAEMKVEDYDQESFNEWLARLMRYSSDGEDWKYGD
jgi:hypothetical protein